MQESDVMGWENEFQGQAADSIKVKKHGGRNSTWWQGREGASRLPLFIYLFIFFFKSFKMRVRGRVRGPNAG